MRVITNRRLIEFAARHPLVDTPLQVWRSAMQSQAFANFAQLKQAFGSADTVGELVVFDIGGNKFRLLAFLHYGQQIAYIKHVFTHAEYDQWNKNR